MVLDTGAVVESFDRCMTHAAHRHLPLRRAGAISQVLPSPGWSWWTMMHRWRHVIFVYMCNHIYIVVYTSCTCFKIVVSLVSCTYFGAQGITILLNPHMLGYKCMIMGIYPPITSYNWKCTSKFDIHHITGDLRSSQLDFRCWNLEIAAAAGRRSPRLRKSTVKHGGFLKWGYPKMDDL